jgi:chromosome partitioning protein
VGKPGFHAAMDTILILSGKGGAGKTTLARELAVAGVLAGRRVALADLDPQVGLTGWYGRRAQETPLLVALPANHDLAELADAGFDELIVDLPPGMPTAVPRLVTQADVVLVPVRASPDDLVAVPAAVQALAGHPCWAFVLNQTPPRSRLVDGTLRHLAGLGRVAPVNLGTRQDYPAAAIEGKAAVEFAGTKSADEVKQLRAYVDNLLRDCHGKATG